MTRNPNERNSGSSFRGRRLRADEVRRARQARSAPVAGRNVQAQRYQPRVSEEFSVVEDEPPRRRWTPFRLGLLAVSLSLLLLAAIFVVPVLIQMQQTASSVLDRQDPELEMVENPEGTPVIATPDDSGGSDNTDSSGDDGAAQDDDSDDDSELPSWDGDQRINIALYGVDSRQDDDSARSDTIIIVSIDPETREVGMMSIPRDLEVVFPEGFGVDGRDKINAAYTHGGRELSKAVIEYNFDIDLHYYAQVDFVGFINIVDTIGGVVIDNQAVIKDDNYEWTRAYFPTGPQHLNGERALRYVRTRYDDNDFARGQRQQQVLRALREQGVRLDLITQARSLLQDVEESFRTDLSLRETLALARMANDIDSENIQSYSIVDCTTEDYVPDQYYYLIPDWECINGVVTEMVQPADNDSGDSPAQDGQDGEGDEDGEEAVDTGASVLIENGTFVNRLAARTRDSLAESGYSNVDVAQANNAGNQPASEILVYSGNEQTATAIAGELGLDPDAVIVDNGEHPEGYDIVVVLGEDAPDPNAG